MRYCSGPLLLPLLSLLRVAVGYVGTTGCSASSSFADAESSDMQYSGEEGDDKDDVGVDGGTGIGNVVDPDPSVVVGEPVGGGEGVGGCAVS